MGPTALAQLSQLPLHGNVRELENLLHRAMALSDDGELQLDAPNLPHSRPAPLGVIAASPLVSAPIAEVGPSDLQSHLDQQEREILVRTLKETGFNRTLAATRLGLSLRQIRYRIARLKIDAPHSPEEEADA
jgi:two-component system response regulator PilR (NtrC family)